MDQSFDANKLTSDLKQMLKLSKSPTDDDISPAQSISSTNSPPQNAENKNIQSKAAETGLKSSGSASADNSKSASSPLISKSSTEKSRKKKQKPEKHVKGQGKALSSNQIEDSSTQSDIKSSKTQGIRNDPSTGKNSPVIVLPSKNKNIRNMDSPKSQAMQGPNMKQQKPESNDNSNASTGKNKYDDLSREIQIKLDQNKIFFLKNRNSRFPNAKYFCRYCDYHMDTIEICEKHIEEDKHCHKKEVGSMDSTLRQIPPPTKNHIEAITEAINLMYAECGIKPEDRDARKAVVQRLEKEIKKDIPDVALYMYGSSLTCMGLKTSDINVNLTSTKKDRKLTTLLKEIYSLLKDCTDNGFSNVHSDFSASVPVLLMTDTETGYKLNIAIHVYSSLCTSELLSIYSDFDERTIKLSIAFRYWANLSGVDRHTTGFIPPIALNIMVIFFLQTVKPCVLPIVTPPAVCGEEAKDFMKDKTIFQLKKNKVMARKSELNNGMSVGELWVRLLKFYTIELDIPEVVISIRCANPLSRRHKPWNSRKLAVEEPYMMKNLTRMLSRCYEYWQCTIRIAYHYFGLPRGSDGQSHLPEHNFPDEGRIAVAPQSTKSTKEEENNVGKIMETCSENDDCESRLKPLQQSDSGDGIIKEDPDLVPKFEYHSDALNSSPNNLTHVSPESTKISDDDVPTRLDTPAAEVPTSQLGSESQHKDSPQSFISDYVDSVVEKALDLVSQRTSSSSLSHSTDHKQNYNNGGESLEGKSENGFCKTDGDDKKFPSLSQKANNEYFFEFNKDYFTNKKEPAMVCVICEKEGHHKNECPEDVLPEVIPVQGFTEQHHKVLEETLKKMPSEVGLSDVSFRERQMFLKCLEDFIQVGFPGARLHLFGSSCNGFGFDRSDMDICMTFVKKRPNIDKVFAVERLANILMVHKDLKNVQAIPTAKVPIVKFTIKNIELDGDISLYNTLAQENTHLLHSYSKIDPRVQILGYTIKMFAQVCDIGDASRGSLSSYGYILMMLYYLQQVKPAVIPVLQEIHNFRMKPKNIVEGWDAWFMSDLTQLPDLWPEMGQNKMSVAELWFGFLRFYVEEFNYRELVISIRQKEPLTRFDKLWNGFCLAIEDPFDLNHNLGSGLTRSMNNFILKTFINGRMLYGSPIDDNMELFNKYQTPSDYFFDTELLSEARPTTSRGCRCCGKIGHLMRHCPMKKDKEDDHKDQKRRKEQAMPSDHRTPPRNPHGKDQQQRQHHSQYQRPQGQQTQHYHHSARNPQEMQRHYSPREDRHSSHRQGKPPQQWQQQQKSHSFQQQDSQNLQRRIERDLFGDRSRGPESRHNNGSAAGQGHHYNMGSALTSAPCAPPVMCGGQHTFLPPQTSEQAPPIANLSSDTSYLYNRPDLFGHQSKMANSPFIRPTTVSPAMNQRHHGPDRNNGPPHQYPPSLRPRSGVMENNNQYPRFGMNPPPGMASPFRFNFNNNPSSGGNSGNSNNMMNANNANSQRMAMIPPMNYMNMQTPQGPGVPSLFPHPGASHGNTRGMSPVVQNLFASTQGKVLDARMMHSNTMKRN